MMLYKLKHNNQKFKGRKLEITDSFMLDKKIVNTKRR